MSRAIVLSGGGARGSYQIGVWKALRKLNIKYDIVTGTSVGALNGMLMAQNTYYRGVWFWHTLSFKYVFKDDIRSDYHTNDGKKAIYRAYAKAIIKDHGMDVTNLESTIDKVLSESKVRKSKIKFGIVTCKLHGFKPLQLTTKDIPVGKLRDYLVASATLFPAFKKKNIDDDNYVDGGYYDNLPINLAVKMGATEIIAVDIGVFGLKRPTKDKNVKITYITPRNNLGSILIFDKDLARRGMRLGYNDTMKTFGYLDGNKYTFKFGHLDKNFMKYETVYKEIICGVIKETNGPIISPLLKLTNCKKRMEEKDLNTIIEKIARIFKIDESYVYDIDKFNNSLLYRLAEIPAVDKKLIEGHIKNRTIMKLINNGYIVKYLYDKIMFGSKRETRDLPSLALLLPNEFLCAAYLVAIQS